MSEPGSASGGQRSNDRYLRWQALRIAQLGLAVALCLSFSVAALGLSISLLVERTFEITDWFAKLCLLSSIITGLLAVVFGFLVYLTRLLDFIATAQVARHHAEPEMAAAVREWREAYRRYGRWTWRLFRLQLITFALQVVLVMLTIGITYVPRLWGHSGEILVDVAPAYTAVPRVSAEWALVVVGSVTFIFVGWQAYETRRSAAASRIAAAAAKDSANSIVTSERAWVVVSLHEVPEVKPEDPGVILLPVVKNSGKTVARVVKFSIRSHIVKSPDGLPTDPEYLQDHETDLILPPNTPLQPMSAGVAQHDFRDALGSKCCLYVYGYVDYVVLERERKQTRFCFMYYPPLASVSPLKPGFYIGIQAPDAYKRCT